MLRYFLFLRSLWKRRRSDLDTGLDSIGAAVNLHNALRELGRPHLSWGWV